ncbi:MAG: rRNA maturation RNase YbeY [Chitinophagaceae bacterium]
MPDKVAISNVQFHFLKVRVTLKERQRLKAFLLDIFKKEKTQLAALQFIFCSDEHLLGINQQFLQHNYYTDIVTFNLANKNKPVDGEIYISIDRVRDNATSLQQYVYIEMHRVIFHGALHLCGYKDKLAKDIALMRQRENHYLKLYYK